MRSVVFAPSFDAEFSDILNYVEDRFGVKSADQYQAKLTRTTLNLAHMPMIGTQDHGYGTVLFAILLYPNWIFYRFTDEEVHFLHIRGGRVDKVGQRFE